MKILVDVIVYHYLITVAIQDYKVNRLINELYNNNISYNNIVSTGVLNRYYLKFARKVICRLLYQAEMALHPFVYK